jgi:hypothetical protein
MRTDMAVKIASDLLISADNVPAKQWEKVAAQVCRQLLIAYAESEKENPSFGVEDHCLEASQSASFKLRILSEDMIPVKREMSQ